MKRRRIVIWFRPEEEYLYLRLLSAVKKTRTGRNWGVSEYLKSLLKYHLFPEEISQSIFDFAYREIFSWRCSICGARGRVQSLHDEGDRIKVQIRCANPEHGWDSSDLIWINYPKSPQLREKLKKWIQERAGKTIQSHASEKQEDRFEFLSRP